ncbi:hypothetical protein [Paenibacillus periandrae]|uniref:hypothetical protein n=1 Tax=Paenibacillus periandrae TaxID=1761741 RepID=UPI001F08DF3D|nr:hypothetical protein [Paenibacillus periandrae]
MLKSNTPLLHPADFDNAMFFGTNIEVFQNGEPIDRGGQIEKHTEDCVYINGGFFIKENCDFKVR